MPSAGSERTVNAAHSLSLAERATLAATLVAGFVILGIVFYPTLADKLYLANDLGHFTIPLRHLYANGLRAGRIDIWTPSLFYGFYEHGEGQMGMFHPLHLLIYRFIPFVQAIGLELVANYLALWAGSYLLFHKWTGDRVAAAFGAFVFAFAGSHTPAIVHVNRIAIVAHMPWMLYALDRYIRREGRNSGYWWAAVALLNGSAILMGYPFWFGLSLVLQAWYVLFLIAEKASIPRAISAACGVTVGLLVGAIQLIPSWAFLHLSNRADPGVAFLAAGSLHPANVLQWANPYFFNQRALGGPWLWEISIYAGIGPLLLFLWLCTQKQCHGRRLQVFLLSLALIGLFLSFGMYNHLFVFYSRLPGFNIFREPCRFSLFTLFAIAGGSALALKQLRANPAAASSRLFNLLAICWLALSLVTVAIKNISLPLIVPYGRFMSSESHVLAGCAIVCTGILLFWCALRFRGWWLAGFLIFALCDISVYAASYLLRLPVGGLDYYEAQGTPVPPPATVVVRSYADQLTLGGYRLANGYAGLMPPAILPLTDPNYLRALGVTAVQDESGNWTTLTLPPSPLVRFEQPLYSTEPIATMNHVDLAKVAVLAQQVNVDASATGSVQIVEERPGFMRIAAQSTGPMFCVLVQRFHPGWTASMDGKELDLMPADVNLTGFVFPGGKQTITLEFHPRDLSLGRDVTWIGLLLLVLGFLAQQLIDRTGRLGRGRAARAVHST